MIDLGNHNAGGRIWVVLGEADVDDQITIVGHAKIDLQNILEKEEKNTNTVYLPFRYVIILHFNLVRLRCLLEF